MQEIADDGIMVGLVVVDNLHVDVDEITNLIHCEFIFLNDLLEQNQLRVYFFAAKRVDFLS